MAEVDSDDLISIIEDSSSLEEIPHILPLMPLRDVVIFTDMLLPLFVARDRSVAALEAAIDKDGFILLVAQKEAATEDPKAGDIFRMGTVARVLHRHHVPYLRDLDPMTGAVIRSSKSTAVRYERQRPGELVHMDVKKLGRIPDGGGWRAHGRGGRKRKHRIGFDYVHSVVDDHSRLAYSEILPNEQGPTCAGFLRRAAAYFADHGITRIEQLMTDNAWAYRYSLLSVCAELGIEQIFIKPHCPWQNGKVERFNRTLQTEWAYRQVFTSNAHRAAALAPWLEQYNTQRRHSALGGLPPISRL